MTAISLEVAQAKLALWLEAEEKISLKQSYTISGRSMSHANLGEVRDQIKFWEKRVIRAQRGGVRVRQVLPNA